MRLLVTGTSGGIGGAVKALALSRGHDVAELNRADFDALASDPRAPLPAGPFDGFVSFFSTSARIGATTE